METIIVSRHPAAVQFIREALTFAASAPALSEATAADVLGKIVVGNIPMHLAVHAAMVIAVEFDGAPPRGAEYTAEDMRKAGARLSTYKVERAYYYAPCDRCLAPQPNGCGNICCACAGELDRLDQE